MQHDEHQIERCKMNKCLGCCGGVTTAMVGALSPGRAKFFSTLLSKLGKAFLSCLVLSAVIGVLLFMRSPVRRDCRLLIHEGFKHHRHVLPSLIFLANKCGVTPFVLTKGRPRHKETMFPLMRRFGLKFKYRAGGAAHLSSFDAILRATFYEYDFLSRNNAIPAHESVFDPFWPHVSPAATRITSVLHDSPQTATSYKSVWSRQNVVTVCMQVAEVFRNVSNLHIPWFHYAFGFPRPSKRQVRGRFSEKTLVVHGGPGNRNYDLISELLSRYCGKLPFKLVVAGFFVQRVGIRPSPCLKVLADLSDKEYYKIIASAYAVLIPLDDPKSHYFSSRCSSGIPTAAAFSVPFVAHEKFARHYGDFSGFFFSSKTSFFGKVNSILELSLAQYKALVSDMEERLRRAEQKAIRVFREVVLPSSCK